MKTLFTIFNIVFFTVTLQIMHLSEKWIKTIQALHLLDRRAANFLNVIQKIDQKFIYVNHKIQLTRLEILAAYSNPELVPTIPRLKLELKNDYNRALEIKTLWKNSVNRTKHRNLILFPWIEQKPDLIGFRSFKRLTQRQTIEETKGKLSSQINFQSTSPSKPLEGKWSYPNQDQFYRSAIF